MAAVQGAFSYIMAVGCVRASRQLHQDLFRALLRLPMSFFDTQPSGRILNRFTSDTQQVDMQLVEVGLHAASCNSCDWQASATAS